MKHVPGSIIKTQKYLPEQTIEELVANVPKKILIEELSWSGWSKSTWKKLYILDTMKKCGIRTASESGLRTKVTATHRNISRGKILDTVKKAIRRYSLDPNQIRVERVVLSLDAKSKATFKRTKKNIKLPDDNRKKLSVLGLVGIVGEGATRVLDELTYKTIACQFVKVDSQMVICSEIKGG